MLHGNMSDRNNYSVSDDLYNSHLFEIDEIYCTDYSNSENVKRMIMNYGGCWTCFAYYYNDRTRWGMKYAKERNPQNYSDLESVYYIPCIPKKDAQGNWLEDFGGHAVELVGWDDNFPKENFKYDPNYPPKGNGAWLCKNSWGYYGDGDASTDQNGNGYFWISYYDGGIKEYGQVCAVKFQSNGTVAQSVTTDESDIYVYPGKPVDVTFTADKTTVTSFPFELSSVPYMLDKYLVSASGNKKTYRFTWTNSCSTVFSDRKIDYKLVRYKNNSEIYRTLQDGSVTVHFGLPSFEAKLCNKDTGSETSITDTSINVIKGNNYKITGEMKYDSKYCNETHGFTFSSSDTSVAEISSDGTINAKKYGSCTITLTNDDEDIPITKKITLKVVSEGISADPAELSFEDCEGRTKTLSKTITITTKEGVDVTSQVTVPSVTNYSYGFKNGVFTYKGNKSCENDMCPLTWSDGVNTYTVNIAVKCDIHAHDLIKDDPDESKTVTVPSNNGEAGYIDKICKTCNGKIDHTVISEPTISVNAETGETKVSGKVGEVEYKLDDHTHFSVDTTQPPYDYYTIYFKDTNDYYKGTVVTNVKREHESIPEDFSKAYYYGGASQELYCTYCKQYGVYDHLSGTITISALKAEYTKDGILSDIIGHVKKTNANGSIVFDQDIDLKENKDYVLYEDSDRRVTAKFTDGCEYYTGTWEIYTRPCLHENRKTITVKTDFTNGIKGYCEDKCPDCGVTFAFDYFNDPTVSINNDQTVNVTDDENNTLIENDDYTVDRCDCGSYYQLLIIFTDKCKKYSGTLASDCYVYKETYIITLDGNGVEIDNPEYQTDYNGNISNIPSLEREGYKFIGWYTEKENGEAVDTNTVFSANTTIYAIWEKTDESITDNPNVDDPNVDDPNVDDPNADDPNVDDLNVDDPNVDDPNVDDPNTDDTNVNNTDETDFNIEDDDQNPVIDPEHICNRENEVVYTKGNQYNYGIVNYYCSECNEYQGGEWINLPTFEWPDKVYGSVGSNAIILVKDIDYFVTVDQGQYKVYFSDNCKYYSGEKK